MTDSIQKMREESPAFRQALLKSEKKRIVAVLLFLSFFALVMLFRVGACQRLLDRCSRSLVSFLFSVPILGFSQKMSRQEAAGATIASWLDPPHPGFCELHFMRAAC